MNAWESKIRWASSQDAKLGNGDDCAGSLCGVPFRCRVYSTGNSSRASYTARVWVNGAAHAERRDGHNGGVKAGREAVRALIRDTIGASLGHKLPPKAHPGG